MNIHEMNRCAREDLYWKSGVPSLALAYAHRSMDGTTDLSSYLQLQNRVVDFRLDWLDAVQNEITRAMAQNLPEIPEEFPGQHAIFGSFEGDPEFQGVLFACLVA